MYERNESGIKFLFYLLRNDIGTMFMAHYWFSLMHSQILAFHFVWQKRATNCIEWKTVPPTTLHFTQRPRERLVVDYSLLELKSAANPTCSCSFNSNRMRQWRYSKHFTVLSKIFNLPHPYVFNLYKNSASIRYVS